MTDAVADLLAASGHRDCPAAVVHFSLADSVSYVGLHRPGRPSTALVTFVPLPGHGAGVLDAVAGIDPPGRQLVARFTAMFPATVDRLSRVDTGEQTTASMQWLLGVSSLLLDLTDDDVGLALRAPDQGVRLDTVVIETDAGHALDGRRLLRSAMSYRVADVPAHVVAASVLTSLGEYAGQAVRRLLRAWPEAELVACTGDLFAENSLLREQTRRSLTGLRCPVLLP